MYREQPLINPDSPEAMETSIMRTMFEKISLPVVDPDSQYAFKFRLEKYWIVCEYNQSDISNFYMTDAAGNMIYHFKLSDKIANDVFGAVEGVLTIPETEFCCFIFPSFFAADIVDSMRAVIVFAATTQNNEPDFEELNISL